jgi:hypothetical protein
MRSLAVVVQACHAPGRPGWETVRAAIEASDIGTNYEVIFHPPTRSLADHVLASLDQLFESGAELCLRLEDDVDVNEHIVHNIMTWDAVHDPRFGAGWLFDPGGRGWKDVDRKAGRPSTETRWHKNTLPYSQAIVFPRQALPDIRDLCAQWFTRKPPHQHQYLDQALSCAIIERGRQIAIHAPALVEHRIDLPSTLKHRHSVRGTATTRGAFAKQWRRPCS